jgi:hypothetical protein
MVNIQLLELTLQLQGGKNDIRSEQGIVERGKVSKSTRYDKHAGVCATGGRQLLVVGKHAAA